MFGSKTRLKQYLSRATRCDKCGSLVYWVPSGSRGFLSDGPNSGFRLHHCVDPKYNYKPFNKKGQPKLRNRKSDLEKEGYVPLILKQIEKYTGGTIIKGVSLADDAPVGLGVAKDISINKQLPVSFRIRSGDKDLTDLVFFQRSSDDRLEIVAFSNCFDEMELYRRTH